MFTIIKKNTSLEETWRYHGRLIQRGSNYIVIEAYFDREDMEFNGMTLLKGDRFQETYFTDKWFNIFEIYNVEDDKLKGWYCNISYPAEIKDRIISYVDLELDLLVFPNGRQVVLDENEFLQLNLSPDIMEKAQQTLLDLKVEFFKRTQNIQLEITPTSWRI